MKDEFGDYSFFQDIADIDENGKVITVSSKKTNDDNDEGEMEDEFGDYSFLANVDIDDQGNVVNQKTDDQLDSAGTVPTSTALSNEERSEDERKREAPRQALVTASSLLRRKKLDDSSNEEDVKENRPAGPNSYSSGQEANAMNGGSGDARTTLSTGGKRNDHELDFLAAMQALGAPETAPVPETTDMVADFWEPSTWGSPQRKRTIDPSNNAAGLGDPIRSPASVFLNPYSPRKKMRTSPGTAPSKARGGTPNRKQGEPERFIVYG